MWWLHLMISHLKRRSKMARAIPPTAPAACSQVWPAIQNNHQVQLDNLTTWVWPLVTHSVPTLILGLQNALIMAAAGIWKAPEQQLFYSIFPRKHFLLNSPLLAIFPFFLNILFPQSFPKDFSLNLFSRELACSLAGERALGDVFTLGLQFDH